MTQNKRDSIYFKLGRLLLAAAAVSAVCFFLMQAASDSLLEYYYDSLIERYSSGIGARDLEDFRDYVRENQVSASDSEALNHWVMQRRMISLEIYRDGVLKYDSLYPDEEAILENDEIYDFYDWESVFTVEFADGPAEVILYGSFLYQLYDYVFLAELLASFAVFMAVVMFGIRKSMNYIRQLSEEVRILEGGGLDYEITVAGRDELSVLARGLDDMRRAFREQTRRDSYLTRANQKMITEMSHDMRTPLTTMLLHTEIMRGQVRPEDSELLESIDKIESKIHQLKQMSENILSYALVCGDEESGLEQPEPFGAVFEDLLSEMAAWLEQNHFHVVRPETFPMEKVSVRSDYLPRILDNLVSNLLKYAEPDYPVQIVCRVEGSYVLLSFFNRRRRAGQVESTRIGLESVRKMMEQMRGSCEIRANGREFETELRFPVCAEYSAQGTERGHAAQGTERGHAVQETERGHTM